MTTHTSARIPAADANATSRAPHATAVIQGAGTVLLLARAHRDRGLGRGRYPAFGLRTDAASRVSESTTNSPSELLATGSHGRRHCRGEAMKLRRQSGAEPRIHSLEALVPHRFQSASPALELAAENGVRRHRRHEESAQADEYGPPKVCHGPSPLLDSMKPTRLPGTPTMTLPSRHDEPQHPDLVGTGWSTHREACLQDLVPHPTALVPWPTASSSLRTCLRWRMDTCRQRALHGRHAPPPSARCRPPERAVRNPSARCRLPRLF